MNRRFDCTRLPRRLLAALACVVALGSTPRAATAEPPGVGAQFDSLTVGTRTYSHVVVRRVSARTISITHDGGLASIPLRELPRELQEKFGYSVEDERAADAQLATAQRRAEERLGRRRPSEPTSQSESLALKFEQLLQSFGQPCELQREVDLRPKFRELSLWIKDQGRRPSCAIFAVVSALEFQNAEITGKAEKFSEEYLIWATRRTTQRVTTTAASAQGENAETNTADDKDEGFTLPDVLAALRAYGIPLQTEMPNTFGTKIEAIPDPAAPVIASARQHRKVFVHLVPGHEPATRLSNLVQALNAGVPVAIGLRWPNYRTLRSGFLSEQKPILHYAHAVTLVGYSCESGKLEDTVFLFKNSWGPAWGEAGYGRVTAAYLQKYLLDGIVLEVQPAELAH